MAKRTRASKRGKRPATPKAKTAGRRAKSGAAAARKAASKKAGPKAGRKRAARKAAPRPLKRAGVKKTARATARRAAAKKAASRTKSTRTAVAKKAARKASSKAALKPASRKKTLKQTSAKKATARTKKASPKAAATRPTLVSRSPRRPGRTERPEPLREGIPSSLTIARRSSAARTGHDEMVEKLLAHTETGPAMTGGDLDANWEVAYSSGDEAPGGDNPTPDQDVVDEIGHALGIEYEDNEELKGAGKLEARDRHRWELDPASAEDYPEHGK